MSNKILYRTTTRTPGKEGFDYQEVYVVAESFDGAVQKIKAYNDKAEVISINVEAFQAPKSILELADSVNIDSSPLIL